MTKKIFHLKVNKSEKFLKSLTDGLEIVKEATLHKDKKVHVIEDELKRFNQAIENIPEEQVKNLSINQLEFLEEYLDTVLSNEMYENYTTIDQHIEHLEFYGLVVQELVKKKKESLGL